MTPVDSDSDSLLALARDIAHRAGAILMEGRPDAPRLAAVATSTKTSPTDIVTERDIASEKFIVGAIHAARPDDGILGEEGSSFESRSGLTWVIDPIDGTINYMYGSPNWAVSIAVRDAEGSLVGVVYAPAVGVEYWAVRGAGSFREDREGAVRLPQIQEVEMSQALFATGFGYRKERRAQQIRVMSEVLPQIRDIRRKGSAALDICMVAAGMVNGYFERGTHLWDIAAASLVATEAGAVVSGLNGSGPGEPMVVCAPPGLHREITGLLESLNADTGD